MVKRPDAIRQTPPPKEPLHNQNPPTAQSGRLLVISRFSQKALLATGCEPHGKGNDRNTTPQEPFCKRVWIVWLYEELKRPFIVANRQTDVGLQLTPHAVKGLNVHPNEFLDTFPAQFWQSTPARPRRAFEQYLRRDQFPLRDNAIHGRNRQAFCLVFDAGRDASVP